MMLKQMRKSMAGENALFGKSQEAKVYQDMMDDSLAQQMSKTGDIRTREGDGEEHRTHPAAEPGRRFPFENEVKGPAITPWQEKPPVRRRFDD